MKTFPTGDLYILHHMELGDCFICKGIVVEYAKRHNVKLLVKQAHLATLRQLYSDTEVKLLPFASADFGRKYIVDNGLQSRTLIIGFEGLDKSVAFDASFYASADLPLELKWTNFTAPRNRDVERDVIERAITKTPYVFAHLSTVRGAGHKFPLGSVGNMPIVQPNPVFDGTTGVLGWLGVIENAEWIVVSNSCYLNLIDLLGIKAPRLVYCRNTPSNGQLHEQPHLQLDWEIL